MNAQGSKKFSDNQGYNKFVKIKIIFTTPARNYAEQHTAILANVDEII